MMQAFYDFPQFIMKFMDVWVRFWDNHSPKKSEIRESLRTYYRYCEPVVSGPDCKQGSLEPLPRFTVRLAILIRFEGS